MFFLKHGVVLCSNCEQLRLNGYW